MPCSDEEDRGKRGGSRFRNVEVEIVRDFAKNLVNFEKAHYPKSQEPPPPPSLSHPSNCSG